MCPFNTNKHGTGAGNENKALPQPGSPENPPEISLMTFHHLLYDSLMPWLRHYDDELLFRALLNELLPNDSGYFGKLVRAFASRRLGPDPALKQEWQVFDHHKCHGVAKDLRRTLFAPRNETYKETFYFYLIINAMTQSISVLDTLIAECSAVMKPYYLNKTLSKVYDMRKRLPELLKAWPAETRLICCCEVALSVIETHFWEQHKSLGFRRHVCLPMLYPPAGSAQMESQFLQRIYDWYNRLVKEKLLSITPFTKASIRDAGESTTQPSSAGIDLHTQDTYISANEAMQILGIKKTTLYELCKKKAIPHMKIGRLYRFKPDEIKQFAETQSIRGSTPT